ncbi:hypothetical protein TanjilG_04788 [Lupinus angustifolius]|uniref:F-box domain-containing protein n=1 Tax=Lupinus angustifolius TaxID=3871 RepID=A0A4P1QRX8_LUPAN|nr:PREDICTED: F-box protein SKIP23-like [Lupinus angustifolius]OIV93556.1 hypothetical protein TanjilG_04788 [Lupinus angustifolius]
MAEKVEWCELPLELWPKIGKYLDKHIDILRFRSVCESWRSSISPIHLNSLSFPLQIPHPINSSIDAYLNQATLYLVEPTHSSSNFQSFSKGYLIKVEESKNHPFRLVSPISDRKINNHVSVSPMVLNLLEYRVFELCKSYNVHSNGGHYVSVNKVVFFPNSTWINIENSVACCVFREGKLGLMKHGYEKWKLVDENNFYYDDVIVFKGQFYVTDKWGTISWIDTCSLKLIQYSPPLCGFGNKKHLVESCGSVYVVDRYYESGPRTRRRNHVEHPNHDAAVECFKVYKLDEEWGKWVDVKNLGDRVFILGNSCNFSVSAKDVIGYEGNCIYFTDMFDVRMYNLQDHSIITIAFDPWIEKFAENWRK